MPAAFNVVRSDGAKVPITATQASWWKIGDDLYEVVVWTPAEWWGLSEKARMACGNAQPCGDGQWVLLRRVMAPPT